MDKKISWIMALIPSLFSFTFTLHELIHSNHQVALQPFFFYRIYSSGGTIFGLAGFRRIPALFLRLHLRRDQPAFCPENQHPGKL